MWGEMSYQGEHQDRLHDSPAEWSGVEKSRVDLTSIALSQTNPPMNDTSWTTMFVIFPVGKRAVVWASTCIGCILDGCHWIISTANYGFCA